MSLHLGNLSSRLRVDELEQVFRKFGRCSVRLKEGYGFVVYDFPPNAEKAIRALRGRNVCGERINITWSNRQPRSFQGYSRGTRSYGSRHGRNSFRENDYASGRLRFNSRQDYRMPNKKLDNNGGLCNSGNVLDEEVNNGHKDVKDHTEERLHIVKEDLPQEGITTKPNVLDDDRWGEQVVDATNDKEVDNGMEFDRYEPRQGDDGRYEDDTQQAKYPDGSPTFVGSREEAGQEKMDGVIFNRSDNLNQPCECYICGELGHKMCNCLQENASRNMKRSRLDCLQGDDIRCRGRNGDELDEIESKSTARLRKDSGLTKQHRNDDKPNGLEKHKILKGNENSALRNGTRKPRTKDHAGNKQMRDNEAPDSYHPKKAKGSLPPSLHYDDSASPSCIHSRPSKSAQGFCSRSRSQSVSSRTPMLSSNSESSKMRSWTSSSTSSSLSVSLNRSLPGSPNKATNAIPKSNETLVGEEEERAVGADSDNFKLDNTKVAVNNENVILPIRAEDGVDENHQRRDDEDDNQNAPKVTVVAEDTCMQLLKEDACTPGRSPPGTLSEKINLTNSGPLENEYNLEPSEKSNMETPFSFGFCRSTILTPEELYMVLQHYGLEVPEENDRHFYLWKLTLVLLVSGLGASSTTGDLRKDLFQWKTMQGGYLKMRNLV